MTRKFQQGDIISMYLRDSRKAVAEARRVLAECDDNSRRALIVNYLPYGIFLAKRFREQGVDFEDLIQVANLAIISAVDDYREGKGKLANFVAGRVRWALVKECRTRRTCITMPDDARDRFTPVVRAYHTKRNRGGLNIPSRPVAEPVDPLALLNDLLRHLAPKQLEFFEVRLSGIPHTEHAARLGVSPQSVRSMERTILRRLYTLAGMDYAGETLFELGVIQREYVPKPWSVRLTAFGRTQGLQEWCNEFRIPNPQMVQHRLKRGMSIEDALTIPSRRVGEKRPRRTESAHA